MAGRGVGDNFQVLIFMWKVIKVEWLLLVSSLSIAVEVFESRADLFIEV